MKKFLSLFLVLTMVLSMLTLPTMAAGEDEQAVVYTPVAIPDSATLNKTEERNGQTYDVYNYNGVDYLVVRTVEQFVAIDDKDGVANFILANDLDFASTTLTHQGVYNKGASFIHGAAEADGWYKLGNFHIEGNGKTLDNLTLTSGTAACGLFPAMDAGHKKITNLTLNVTATLKHNSVGILIGGTVTDTSDASSITIDNVTMNVESLTTSGGNNIGLFVAKPRVKQTTITNCTLNNGYTSAANGSNQGVAGFVGRMDTADTTTTIENCKATGTYTYNAGNANAIFVGYANNGAINLNNCTMDVTATITTGKSGGFVGYIPGSVDLAMTNCTAKGTYTFHGGQAAVMCGQIETATPVDFVNCSFDGTIISTSGDTHGVYVGMVNKAGGVVNFTNCTSSGTFIDKGTYNGRGWATGFVACAGHAAATVNFESCSTDMLLMGYDNAAGFVASTKNANAQMKYNFSGCTSNVTILSGGVAGAFVAQDFGVVTYDMMGCVDNSTIIAASNYDLSGLMDEANGTVKTYDKASGELAYKLVEAQKAAGVPAEYYFGQTIGTDAQPKVGGATVYGFVTNKVGTFYSNNAEYVYTLTDAPKAYVQYSDLYAVVDEETSLEYDAFNTRVIIAVSEAKLDEVATANITLTFKKGDEVVKTKTFGNAEVNAYYAVYAGDQIAQAADGYVLVAVTVTGIPTEEWNQTEGTVSVTMNVTDANGDPIPEYTLA